MTPQSSIGMGNVNGATAPASSSGLYNSISSQGLTGEPSLQNSQEPVEQTNPAEQVIQRFGQVFGAFQTLSSDPMFAVANKEAENVRNAFKNWLEVVVSSTSKVGGESSY